jgi:hypothetical protein
MKGSAVTHDARPVDRDGSSAFQRFAKVMRALIAVPKRELDEKLAQDRKRKVKRR